MRHWEYELLPISLSWIVLIGFLCWICVLRADISSTLPLFGDNHPGICIYLWYIVKCLMSYRYATQNCKGYGQEPLISESAARWNGSGGLDAGKSGASARKRRVDSLGKLVQTWAGLIRRLRTRECLSTRCVMVMGPVCTWRLTFTVRLWCKISPAQPKPSYRPYWT